MRLTLDSSSCRILCWHSVILSSTYLILAFRASISSSTSWNLSFGCLNLKSFNFLSFVIRVSWRFFLSSTSLENHKILLVVLWTSIIIVTKSNFELRFKIITTINWNYLDYFRTNLKRRLKYKKLHSNLVVNSLSLKYFYSNEQESSSFNNVWLDISCNL